MITSSIPQQAEKIHESLNVLFNSGDVVEMRIPKAGKYRTISGYFDNGKALSEAAATYSGKYAGVYVTLNPVHKGLLARSNNKAASYAANTTSDNNILKRCWFYIDFDPKRPAGISSTDEEHAAAIERAKKVRDKLLNNGFPSPILADSGNGAHLLYRIDLPNDEESKTLITNCLKALDYHFSDQVVDIDIGVYNAARICKLYGTIACKGDNTEERPHREAKIINVPKPVEVVPKKHLKALANTKPKEPERTQNKRYESHGGGGSFDIEQYMTDHGLTISKEKAWQGGTVYELEECPFNPDHKKGDSSIIQFPGGAVSFQCFHNSCQGNDWHKLRDLLEGDHRKSYTKPYPQENFALEPTKLPGEPETPSLGAGMIPEPLRPWLIDVSERASIPLEFVAIPAIVALGSIIGRRIAIRPGRFDDWTVVPNLWGGIVGRPGVMKSYAVNEALKPVSRLAAKAIQDFEDKKAMAEAEEVEQKAEMDAIKKQMAKEAKKGGDTEALKAELAEKIKEINDCAITQKRYLIQDPTVEKLGELLQENPHGLLLSRDELSGWLRTLDKPGHEGDREFYLESWNGTGSFTFDRIGRGTTHIPAVCLSIIGGIQPGRLKSYITGALQANGSADDGLLQRLQLLVWPDKMGEWTNKELKPDKEAREQAFRLYEALETLTAEAAGATYDIDSELPFLKFSPEAQDVFNEWRNQLENRLRSDEMESSPAWESHLAKYRSLMPSLALIFHLVDVVDWLGGMPVSENATRLAADWCTYLEAHAKKVYTDEMTPGIRPAHLLLKKVKDGKIGDGETIGSIQQHKWSGLGQATQIYDGLEILEQHGWVQVVTEESGVSGGRPSKRIYLHPKIKKS